jgi:hypothetical protein
MSEYGMFSIWKSEPALDSWYNAAVGRDASLHGIGQSDMDEILFFDISKSNQVTYSSSTVNSWFYGAANRDNTSIEDMSNPSQF